MWGGAFSFRCWCSLLVMHLTVLLSLSLLTCDVRHRPGIADGFESFCRCDDKQFQLTDFWTLGWATFLIGVRSGQREGHMQIELCDTLL